jgi:hypothetical protein
VTKALIVQLADDVVSQLNKKQGGWTVKFEAKRQYTPKAELEETDSVVAKVAIAAWRVAPDNRTEWAHEYDIDIGIQYRANPAAGDQATAKFDEVLRLAEEISDYWEDTRPTVADCPLMNISFGPSGDAPYIPDHIEKFNQITTVIKLTFWKLR